MFKTCSLIKGQLDKKENKKFLEDNFWYRAETPAVMATAHPFMIGFGLLKGHFPHVYDNTIVFCGSGYFWFYATEDESLAVGKMLYEKFSKDENFIHKKHKEWQKDLAVLHKLAEKIHTTDLSKLSNRELASRYDEFLNAFYVAWTIPLILEMNTVYVEQELAPRIKKELGVSTGEFNDILALMSQPLVPSYLTNERIDFLRLALKFSAKKLKEHSEKYYWQKTSYRRISEYSQKEIKKLLDAEIRKGTKHIIDELTELEDAPHDIEAKQKEFVKKYGLSQSHQKLFKAMGFYGDWQDKRKEMNIYGNHQVFTFVEELSRRYKINGDFMAHAFHAEVVDVLEGRANFDKKELERRFKFGYHFVRTDLKEIFLVGKEAQDLKRILDKKIEERFKEIKGMVASMGKLTYTKGKVKVIGKVKVVFDPHGVDIPEGTVLVTPMTRPDFVHLMYKASAIVTDQGGITSHAAILSREIGIPCIVGTGTATELLKNGDTVEVDTDSGVVVKL